MNLPTLNFVEERLFENKTVLIAEDLNNNDQVYITPNSLISDSQRKLNALSKPFIKPNLLRKDSISERFRYENKLSKIINFEDFILKSKQDLILVSKSKVLIDFDSYFFGSLKHKKISEISYKIADFDNINQHKKAALNNITDSNYSEFKRSVQAFVKYFVEVNENQKKYFDVINNEL